MAAGYYTYESWATCGSCQKQRRAEKRDGDWELVPHRRYLNEPGEGGLRPAPWDGQMVDCQAEEFVQGTVITDKTWVPTRETPKAPEPSEPTEVPMPFESKSDAVT